ncbi:MAG: transposase [Bacteroidales bacterium]|nr:transposase [Bacteroidales bacterium]
MPLSSPYRPHDPGHDYYGVGIYLITLVVGGRQPLLGRLCGDAAHPEVQLTPVGEMVHHEWQVIPAKAAEHGNQVRLLTSVCMPDHFHGVIEVLSPMSWCLGDVMQAFKAACTSRWHEMQGLAPSYNRPISEECRLPTAPAWLRDTAARCDTEAQLIRALGKRRREEYYAMMGRGSRPLFDANYDDTICLDARHRAAMIAYVHDNPRRALLRRLLPDVMQRSLRVLIGGREYGTFGNLFLLRWARRVQVFCHRRHPVTRQPYETTPDYARDHAQWVADILTGATVIVTPGVSRGELLMKNECLEHGYPLIHIQKEPIHPYWKPERQRFEACAAGRLLILAPWRLDDMSPVAGIPADSDYSRFHNLNRLAAEVCSFSGEARIMH